MIGVRLLALHHLSLKHESFLYTVDTELLDMEEEQSSGEDRARRKRRGRQVL
jgi:hypothetical protein